MQIFTFISLLILAVIFWQDLRSRAIWWFLPPALFASFCLLKNELMITMILHNILFVVFITASLFLYTRIRFGKFENLFTTYFGLGDFLFLLALTPLFPLNIFVWFFTAGTIAVLVIHFTMQLFRKENTIPYAGYFSVFTGFFIVSNSISPELLISLTPWNG